MNSTLLLIVDFVFSWKIVLHILHIKCIVSRMGFVLCGWKQSVELL